MWARASGTRTSGSLPAWASSSQGVPGRVVRPVPWASAASVGSGGSLASPAQAPPGLPRAGPCCWCAPVLPNPQDSSLLCIGVPRGHTHERGAAAEPEPTVHSPHTSLRTGPGHVDAARQPARGLPAGVHLCLACAVLKRRALLLNLAT